jgi:AraC-like DNA-binding protein
MSEAAKELVFTAKPIKLLAGEYQYESQASFTRSFTAVYGLSPGKLRRQVGPLQFFDAMIKMQKGDTMITPVIKQKDGFRVVAYPAEHYEEQQYSQSLE